MPERPTLLLYCQHSLGIGHLTRSFALAAALLSEFRVVILNGGPIPAGVPVPRGVEKIDLPPLGMDDGHTVVSRGGGAEPVEAIQRRRREMILAAQRVLRPALVLIELYPFGRKKFAHEIVPLLRAARRDRARIVCSLRDILVTARPDQQRFDDRARWLADRYFDAVLVHADPALARLEDTFRPARRMSVPVHYTGFVTPERDRTARPPARGAHVLVSAGGGSVGAPLFDAALAAHARLWAERRLPMRIVAGPFLPEPDWQRLQQAAAQREGLSVVRQVPDLAAEMQRAAVSVSQCGYNSALDIIAAQVPALVIPYSTKTEDEQARRAQRLAALGVLRRWPDGMQLDGQSLAGEIAATLPFRPAAARIGLDGAGRSTALLAQLVGLPARAALDIDLAQVA
jgi:predicted glycosyltransferase